MLAKYILLELMIGAMLLGFIGAYKKRLFDRIVLFASIPVAFFGSIIFTKSALFDEIVQKVMEMTGLTGADPETASSVVETLIPSVGVALVRPFIVTVLFWVSLFVLRILLGITLFFIHTFTGARRRAKKAKKNGVKKPLWNKIGTGVTGALSGFVIVMLSTLPLVYVNNLTEPAVNAALEEQYKGTYVNELASTISENAIPLGEDSIITKIQNRTGMRTVINKSLEAMTDVTVKSESGTEVTFNLMHAIGVLGAESVRVTAVYEKTCDANSTLKDIAPVADVLARLAKDDNFITAGTQLFSYVSPMIFGTDDIAYNVSDVNVLKADATAVSELIKLLSTDLAEVKLDEENLLPELLAYLENEDSSKKFVKAIAISDAYNENFPTLMEYALVLICDQMDLSEDKSEDYTSFVRDMNTALDDKAVAPYDPSAAEKFIIYCVDNDITVSSYAISNPDRYSEYDIAYINYVNFIQKKNAAEKVYSDYLLNKAGKVSFFVANGGSIYSYDSETDKWSLFDGEISELCSVSYAAQLLANRANAFIKTNPEYVMSEDDVGNFARELIDILRAKDSPNETELATLEALAALCGVDDYNPTDTVYRTDIMNALNKDAELDEEHNENFAVSLSIMAGVYASLTEESDEASIDTIMDNFDDIGRLLDSMKKMESTKDIPDKMLTAIMRNKNYGQYFESEGVQLLIQNVKDGTSTYEQLFTTVQAIYGLANSIGGKL